MTVETSSYLRVSHMCHMLHATCHNMVAVNATCQLGTEPKAMLDIAQRLASTFVFTLAFTDVFTHTLTHPLTLSHSEHSSKHFN